MSVFIEVSRYLTHVVSTLSQCYLPFFYCDVLFCLLKVCPVFLPALVRIPAPCRYTASHTYAVVFVPVNLPVFLLTQTRANDQITLCLVWCTSFIAVELLAVIMQLVIAVAHLGRLIHHALPAVAVYLA